MTDNEIIKDCKSCLHYEACKGTYYSAKGDEDILHEFEGEMYGHNGCEDFEDKDLINRQKAEIESKDAIILKQKELIERTQKLVDDTDKNCRTAINVIGRYERQFKSIKAEAIKEFAERLKLATIDIPSYYFNYATVVEYIDNLVKEMVGEG